MQYKRYACIIDSAEQRLQITEAEQGLLMEHPATVDPISVPDECLAVRIAQCSSRLQRHVCGDGCLVMKMRPEECRRIGFEPNLRTLAALPPGTRHLLVHCKKHFPRPLPVPNVPPKAHVVIDTKRMVRYSAPRDDGYVNACHPVYAHVWGANTDLQVLHGKGMAWIYRY